MTTAADFPILVWHDLSGDTNDAIICKVKLVHRKPSPGNVEKYLLKRTKNHKRVSEK